MSFDQRESGAGMVEEFHLFPVVHIVATRASQCRRSNSRGSGFGNRGDDGRRGIRYLAPELTIVRILMTARAVRVGEAEVRRRPVPAGIRPVAIIASNGAVRSLEREPGLLVAY